MRNVFEVYKIVVIFFLTSAIDRYVFSVPKCIVTVHANTISLDKMYTILPYFDFFSHCKTQ